MTIFDRLSGLFGKRRAASDLQQNMRKALHMKQEAGSQTHIPPHQTAREGMKPVEDANIGNAPAGEAGFTPELKRSRVSRSGDT
jgi:hypothetical protein